jgi:hypothetical protein
MMTRAHQANEERYRKGNIYSCGLYRSHVVYREPVDVLYKTTNYALVCESQHI